MCGSDRDLYHGKHRGQDGHEGRAIVDFLSPRFEAVPSFDEINHRLFDNISPL
ncbi:hypothetical protein DPMN_074583 [Dreissena polymorpha]|uniref:Uncharacterized protein n=1 Tax=Dreissena polymorpha TaxID=45954 RepID=A0A9D3YI02_DREPO|nr:hypothetical protein DPMN_074583 [Dreissena polymorpha]